MVPTTSYAGLVGDGPPIDPRKQYRFPDELDQRFTAFLHDALRYRQIAPTTAKWYGYAYRIFAKFLVASKVDVIDAGAGALIQEWLARARERGVSAFSVRSYWQGLRAFFVFLEREDGLLNPFRRLPPPKVPRDPLPKALTLDECTRILAGARNTRWKTPYERARAVAMIGVALYTGLRRSEILRLRVEDVDLVGATIRVLHGKGNKQRVAPINAHLDALLREFLAARDDARLASVEFFAAQNHGRGVQARTFLRIVERVRQTAGVRFTIHQLRHSFITELVRQDVSPLYVKELAGHRDLKTTERYTRIFDREKFRAVERLSFEGDAVRTPHPDAAS